MVLRERFSSSDFWPDIVRHDCTLFQYIGELCRYLVNSPPHPDEARHRLRLVCGNGLRPDIWNEFKQRFRIPKIIEFYAATEGNVTLFNFDGKPGAVGRIPWYLAHRFPTATIKYDVETDRPIRGADGLCIRCAPDEPGEAIGKIVSDPTMPGNRFEGYANKADDEHKILRDVFEPGDAWFRTGDLLRQDAEGYYYFVDRVGDTFRWKGENVSTTEVADMIARFPGIRDVTVYGVHVAGQEGRAGMAALVTEDGLDLGSAPPPSRRSSAGLRPAAVPAHPRRNRPDIDLQAEKDRPEKAGFRSDAKPRTDLFQRSGGAGLRTARRRSLSPHSNRTDQIMNDNNHIAAPAEVLAFWREAGPEKWFKKDDAFDAEIKQRFLSTYEAAAAGRLAEWAATAEGTLALLLVLDQFPRNMFRGSARMFAADPLAKSIAEEALARGFDRQTAMPDRTFFYLPFEHSEDLANQERCVALCQAYADAEAVKWAELHADIIRRFGRFPHRNAVLGRQTTPEEQAFLDDGGFAG